MFWFKNLMAYRLTQQIDFSSIEAVLQEARYTPCNSSDMSRFGWDKTILPIRNKVPITNSSITIRKFSNGFTSL